MRAKSLYGNPGRRPERERARPWTRRAKEAYLTKDDTPTERNAGQGGRSRAHRRSRAAGQRQPGRGFRIGSKWKKVLLGMASGLLLAGAGHAQLSNWKLGGSGLPWTGQDTASVLIDFASAPGAIQPVYIPPDVNILSLLDDWSFLRQPRELGYVDGERPRVWKWNEGNGDPTENGVALIDGDSTTYNSSKAEGVEKQFFTIDLAVPVPAHIFGFHAPSGGFRADGTLLRKDSTPAFQVSMQQENSEIFAVKGALPLEQVIAEVTENFDPDVRIQFPRQYVRFFRWARKLSLIDEEALTRNTSGGGQGNQALSLKGTISEFEVYGEGVPRRALYKTKITPLGQEQNFGRLFFAAAPMRRVGGQVMAVPDAQAGVQIEARTGRDEDPNVYREYTVTGKEKVVSRQRYEDELRQGFERTCASCDFVQRSPRPGLRAPIGYDAENWTFWSTPITQSGQPLNLSSGSYLQLKITLNSSSFFDFVRLDSVWIEQAPLLAERVIGEVAPLEDPQPARGVAAVSLGRMIDFAYDLRASFSGQAGFDGVRIRTGSRPRFRYLEVGGVPSEPRQVREEADGLTVFLPERLSADNNAPLRIVFGAELFELATTFLGEAISSQTQTLPQPVVEGNASEELSTNSLRVLSTSGRSPSLLQGLRFSTAVLTPNGDGIRDQLEIAYALFGLPAPVPVGLEVYALDGRRVAALRQGEQTAGPQAIRWDGRDQERRLLPPGLYLISITLHSERSEKAVLRPVGLAY